MSDTGADGDTGVVEGLKDVFPETNAWLYQSGVLGGSLPIFTTCPSDIHPEGTGSGKKPTVTERKSVEPKQEGQRQNSKSSDGCTSVGEMCPDFTLTDQCFYSVRRQEAEVALYDLSLEAAVTSTSQKEVTSNTTVAPSRTAERRRKQRERQKEMKKQGTNRKSPSPPTVVSMVSNPKEEKPEKSQKSAGGKAKKATVATVISKEGKVTEGRKSPKPRSGGGGRKSPSPTQETTPEDDSKFEKDFIFPLKKKSLKFPKAKYFCRLCDYHCDDAHHIHRHVKDNRHQSLKKAKIQDVLLAHVPPPTPLHTAAVTDLIESVYKEHSLTDYKNRNDVLQHLTDIVNRHFPGVELRLYGSSVTGFGLKGVSDVNIELTANKAPPALMELYKFLKADKSGYFSRVESDFADTVPSIHLHAATLRLFVKVGIPSSGPTPGSSWLVSELLRVYAQIDPRVTVLGVAFRRWARLCGIDKQEAGTLPAYAFSLMVVFFLQQCEPPVLPVLHQIGTEEDRTAGAQNNMYFNDIQNLSKFWRCDNTSSVGALWIGLCRFYALEFDVREKVVCIRQWEQLDRGEKKWTKRLPIEDPFQRKRNITRSISHVQVFDYITEQLKNLYQYFSIPQTHAGPLYKDFDLSSIEADLADSMRDRSPRTATHRQNSDNQLTDRDSASPAPKPSASQELLGGSDEEDSEESLPNVYSLAAGIAKSAINQGMRESVSISQTTDKVPSGRALFDTKLPETLKAEDLHFVFSKDVFCKEKGPPRFCSLCQKQTHLQQDCPDVRLPPLTPLPPLSKRYQSMLDAILLKVPRDFQPSQMETDLRHNLRVSLETYIRQLFRDARLYLFGSSCNGFGFSHSDMDICMVLENTDSETVDHLVVITTLSKHLRKHSSLQNVLAITTAKVPIVKFRHKHSGLDGDISLYNTLAVHNTRMLEMYCKLDYRVCALGYTMKVFAKLCDICDASKGSLSSYAYVLMVIYFLQQRQPPVIPVLQELHTGSKPVREVDGWNAWFYDDLKSVRNVWPDAGKNKESLAELWVGLLRFYTEEFNYRDFVISIRQKEMLTRFEKLWNGKCLAIEDPFDLNHNLGGGLSRKMDHYIKKAFHNGRSMFGQNIQEVPKGYSTLEDYLFDPKLLTESAPPNDRNCRICNKIGHWAKECPTASGKKERSHNGRAKAQSHTGKENKDSSANAKVNGNKDSQARSSEASKPKETPVSTKTSKESSAGNNTPPAKTSDKKSPGKQTTNGGKGAQKRKEINGSVGKAEVHAGTESVAKKKTEKQAVVSKEKQQEKSKKRKVDALSAAVSSGMVRDRVTDDKAQKQKGRVFYNKQRGPGLPTTDYNSDNVKVTPRAVYINHASSVQISPRDASAPSQQFFMNHGSSKSQQPPALMDLQFNKPPLQAYQGFNPGQFGQMNMASDHGHHDNSGGGLTWQQASLLQEATSPKSPRSRGRRTKSENQSEEFPMLEVTVPNERFTWQQQQQYLQRNRKRGQRGQRKKKPANQDGQPSQMIDQID